MKRLLLLSVTAGMFFCAFAPEQASAQLFRRWQEENTRNNYSTLPGAAPSIRRAPDYGAEQVSAETRNEVSGRTHVGAAPDFMSDAPLAKIAKQYQNPAEYTSQLPIEIANRQQPPRSKYNKPVTFGPHWITPYSETSDQCDAPAVEPEEMTPQSDGESNPTVEL